MTRGRYRNPKKWYPNDVQSNTRLITSQLKREVFKFLLKMQLKRIYTVWRILDFSILFQKRYCAYFLGNDFSYTMASFHLKELWIQRVQQTMNYELLPSIISILLYIWPRGKGHDAFSNVVSVNLLFYSNKSQL